MFMATKKSFKQSSNQAQPEIEIPKSVLKDAVAFLDAKYSIGDVYAALGMQLDALSAIERPMDMEKWMTVGVDIPKMKVGYMKKGRDFLAKYWKNIQENACDWWKKNKDKAGDKLVAGLTAVIAATLPLSWAFIPPILALIAVILIKAGLDTVCEKKVQPPK
jgi:hypothetical protein